MKAGVAREDLRAEELRRRADAIVLCGLQEGCCEKNFAVGAGK